MRCPFCGHLEHRVLESRVAKAGDAIRRRRECESCKRRFNTFESPERARVYLVKRDGSSEEFDREKLLRGLVVACRKRPVSYETLLDASAMIERELFDRGESEVQSDVIGKLAMVALLGIDKVAYVRFASVYDQFSTPDEFLKLVEKVTESPII